MDLFIFKKIFYIREVTKVSLQIFNKISLIQLRAMVANILGSEKKIQPNLLNLLTKKSSRPALVMDKEMTSLQKWSYLFKNQETLNLQTITVTVQ